MNNETVRLMPNDPDVVGTKNRLNNGDDELTRLKLDINALLWMTLPGATTIKRAEIIACKIHGLISHEITRIDNSMKPLANPQKRSDF